MKKAAEVMEILEAFDLTGSLRGAAELAGCDHKTVAHWVAAREEAGSGLPVAVRPRRVVISGHVTGDGPCLYCLHIGDVLDTEQITFKLIVTATGLPPATVQGLLEQHVPLTALHIQQIEDHRHLNRGKLRRHLGSDLLALYEAELRYAETTVDRDGHRAAVAAPFVTALAGALLAGEGLKAGAEAYRPYRLGPFQTGRTRYDEDVLGSVANALVTPVMRWEGSECLCRSTRRQRLVRERYQI